MSDTLKNIGKDIADYFTGGGEHVFDTTEADKARANALMKNLITGGAALGGGTALGVMLVNYLRSLKKERELADNDRLDDDTLYIPVKHTKSASILNDIPQEDAEQILEGIYKEAGVSPYLAPGLAVTGAAVAGGMTYAVVMKAYRDLQRAKLQKQLDEAQAELIDAGNQEAELAKESSADSWGLSDTISAIPVAAPLLALLASGGITYAALNKSFPVIKPKRIHKPKRIRVIRADDEDYDEDEENEDIEKEAAFNRAHDDFCAAGDELLINLVANMDASEHNITKDILYKAANCGIGEMEDALLNGGYEALIAVTKGAGDHIVTDRAKELAAIGLNKSAALAPVVRGIAAAEFVENVPETYSMLIAGNDGETMTKLAHIGCILGLQARQDSLPEWAEPLSEEEAVNVKLEKSASATEILDVIERELEKEALLSSIAEGLLTPGHAEVEEGSDDELTSDISDRDTDDVKDEQYTDDDTDAIDDILSPDED